ncbi:Retrovirus-related Pol polyprotein from transposon 17.6, partial [Mucuna pruriens]
MLDQLHKTRTRISLLSLLINLESHCELLLKMLNEGEETEEEALRELERRGNQRNTDRQNNPARFQTKADRALERIQGYFCMVLSRYARTRHCHRRSMTTIEENEARVAKYPQWVANIVPVPKNDGKVDLKRASPKDNFPLPYINLLVDNTAQYPVIPSLMDSPDTTKSGWPLEDKEKTTFITTWGTFCYKVMPFGLKNVRATYQRAMVTLFHDMMHKEMEVYVDDMIAKSKTPRKHIDDLRKLFEKLRKYRLKLNPAKCTFGVGTGKLLGFILNERGIELDPDKVKAIRDMSAPKNKTELTAACSPIFKLLRKNQKVEWNQECQEAFEKVKQYLDSPPVLIPAVPGKPLILYLTQNDSGKEQAIYYLNKKFTECEQRYSALERTCCALVWAVKRLRQYMLTHTTRLIAKMEPLKYIFEKPALTGQIARLQMALSEYDIKAIKGSALAEQLAYHPLDEYHPLSHEFSDEHIMPAEEDEQEADLDEWKLWFNGASNLLGNRIGVVLASPKGQYFPFSTRLGFDCTNNMTEYEACTMGITMGIEHLVSRLNIFGDSALVIYQLHGEWETRDAKLVPYHAHIVPLKEHFDEISFHYVPWDENQTIDALVTPLAMLQANRGKEMTIHVRRGKNDGKPWYHDIREYLKEGVYPPKAIENDKRTLKRLAVGFLLNGVILYKRSVDLTLLRCVDNWEAREIMEEVHGGAFGTHANGHALARKILRTGYYWS